ncbi:MAG TPA: aminotransferase class III-fold pyridoxal phosphate-dependent enzyme, partial [Polyangiaceae bacterium]|nr:aminotransferase class III-fold pyridoxal phosphate-dependent enzyme [Polyangiaceae bacterium]
MNWAARLARVECPAFPARQSARRAPTPIVLARGDGDEIWDVDGRRYVDLTAGFGSLLLGHGHPGWSAALAAQSARLVQGLGDVYASDVKVMLLEELAALHPSPGARVLLTQSGSDAVTAAIKTAMLATGKNGIIAFDGAYHGLGYAPLPACGFSPSFAAPFEAQLNPHVRFAPYPGLRGATLDASLSFVGEILRGGDVGLVLVEPVLGRGGIVVPPLGFLESLRELAHEHGALVAADEIWTGLGRAGAWRSGDDVDILCFGKG